MKRSSILVPIILIACLLALALLISRVFKQADAEPELPEDNVATSKIPNATPPDSVAFYDAQGEDLSPSSDIASSPKNIPPSDNDILDAKNSGSYTGSRFLVLAGTFRQRANAQARVIQLRAKGFSATEVANFDKGTFAVALVGRSETEAAANALARKVREAGFEALVQRQQ